MNIRSYRDSDLEAVVRLFTASVHCLATDDYDAVQRSAWAPSPPDLNEWRLRLAALKTVVAEQETQLAGFIAYEENGHIALLYASPAHVRCGVASALYRHVESSLTSLGVEELHTQASCAARSFFEHHGFRVVAEQDFCRRGVSFRRYIMRKSTGAAEPSRGGAKP